MNMKWKCALSSSIAIAIVPPVYAQGIAPAASQTSLEDIVVTAQKRSENLQDVPIAITALSGVELTSKGIQSTQDLTMVAPGVNTRKTNNQFQVYIRGIGTGAGFVENPVSLYVDGVYIADQRGAFLEFNDLEQIEVLKGPQGTLFGRNSTAGVIQVRTREPSQDLKFIANAGIDNYATLRSDAYITGGLAPNLAASLSVNYTRQGEGYGRNVTTGEDVLRVDHRFSIRGKLKFEPTDHTKIVLIADHFHDRLEGGNQHPYPGTSYAYPGYTKPPSIYDSLSDANRLAVNASDSASIRINQDLDFAELTSISAYRRGNGSTVFDADGIGSPLFRVDIYDAPSHNFTQELQLSSPGNGPFTWQVGAYYFWNKDEVRPSISKILPPFFPSPAGATLTRISTQTTESIAGFGQASWEFLPETKLTGGVRYTYEKRDFNGLQTLAIGSGPATGAPIIGSLTSKKPTFRVSLDHQFPNNMLLYASFNTGFKSGGYNLLAPTSPAFQPENLKAYEAGLKSELFDRRLRFNAAAFYYDYSNIQVFQVINNVSTISNAAKARLYGLDIDFEARLAEGLTLSGGLELLHAKFTRYDNAQIATPKAGGGITIGAGPASGKRLPLAQNASGSAALDYDTEALDAKLHFNVTASYQGDFYFEPDNFQRQRSNVLINSSIRITPPGEHVSVTLWGRNLLDKVTQTFGSTNAFGANAVYESTPRTYGITLRTEF